MWVEEEAIFVFIDGQYAPLFSSAGDLSNHFQWTENEFFLTIPAYYQSKKIIRLIHLHFQSDVITHHKNTVRLESNSDVTLIEEYYAGTTSQYYFNFIMTEYDIKPAATLNYYKIQNEHSSAAHAAYYFITQSKHSTVNTFELATGGKNTLENRYFYLVEDFATCHADGVYLLNAAHQKMQYHLHVYHDAPHGKSAIHYKGVCDNKSQAAFHSYVVVPEAAVQTNAYQANHHLLLSKDAAAESRPELKIYADAIQCKHGATVGQLDPEALFYCRSRGITYDTARKLLTEAFINELIDNIPSTPIQQFIQHTMNAHEIV